MNFRGKIETKKRFPVALAMILNKLIYLNRFNQKEATTKNLQCHWMM